MTDKKLIELIVQAMSTEGQDGLHIVIDDGNVEDRNIKWCRDEWTETTERGKVIANELLRLGERKRNIIIGKAWETWKQKE